MINHVSIAKGDGPRAWLSAPRERHGDWRCILFSALAVLLCAERVGTGDEDAAVDVAIQEPRFTLTPQRFDAMLFRRTGFVEMNGVFVQSTTELPVAARRQMEKSIASEIEQLTQVCRLSPAQRKKIELAARGDVVRFFDRIDVLRQKCTTSDLSQAEYSALMTELQALSYVPSFIASAESSLCRKSLNKVLNSEQKFRYQELERSRRRGVIERALRQTLDRANSADKVMAHKNREKFIEVLLTQAEIPSTSHPYAATMVMLEAARLQEQLRPFLTDIQSRQFQSMIASAQRMEPTLRRMGIWPLPLDSDDSGTDDEDSK